MLTIVIELVGGNAERASQVRVSDGQTCKKEAKQPLGSISSAVVNSNQIKTTKKKKSINYTLNDRKRSNAKAVPYSGFDFDFLFLV